MHRMLPILLLLLCTTQLHATTTLLSPHVYQVDAGVEFLISNDGANSFLFSWSDDGGAFTDIADPSFVVMIGQTYVFRRTSSSHPLILCDDTLPVDGTDGSMFRTTSDAGVIAAAQLTPVADFTADPAPTTDAISWTPGPLDLGNFYYTCLINSHVGMTGKTRVVEPIVDTREDSWSAIKALY